MTFYLSTLGFKCLIMFLFCDEMYYKNNMKNAYVSILQILKEMYGQPALSLGFCIQDSTKCRTKILGGKNFQSSKVQNLNLPCSSHYLHSFYIAVGAISNPEMILEDVSRLYAIQCHFI